MIGVVLFIIAYIFFFPMTIINYFNVAKKKRKGYFKNTALALDIFANREFRATWNKWLITGDGYQFGIQGETISSALGKNQVKGTLTNAGKVLVSILNRIEKDHCLNSITNFTYRNTKF